MRGLPVWLFTLPLILFWDSALVLPLKLLVVGAHEAGHGLAAILTGGHVIDLLVAMDASGHALTRGGSEIVVLNAGYLASLLSGAVCLWLASDEVAARIGGVGLGALLVYAGVSWFVPGSADFIGLVGTGTFLVFGLPFARYEASEAVLQSVGVFNLIYSLYDIVVDTLLSPHSVTSDAALLAQLTGVPVAVWGGGWLLGALGLMYMMRRFLF